MKDAFAGIEFVWAGKDGDGVQKYPSHIKILKISIQSMRWPNQHK